MWQFVAKLSKIYGKKYGKTYTWPIIRVPKSIAAMIPENAELIVIIKLRGESDES